MSARAMSESRNIHASALVVGTTGILVTGPSGSGKSAFALALVAAMRWRGRFARLVADDRVDISASGDRVIAVAPRTIAGLAEARGTGLLLVPHIGRAVIHCATAPATDERLPPDDETMSIAPGIALPVIRLRYADPCGAIATLAARIGIS